MSLSLSGFPMSSLESAAELSRVQPFPMTHHCVSLFLNIFSLHCCVFILSEWGRCYGLHTTFVYGLFNQDQIMESCLHSWAHPQKLGDVCVCVCCYALMIPAECSNKYFSQENISTQTMNRIKVCMCIVHQALWGDVCFLCYTWCHPVLIMSTALPLLLAVSSPWQLCYHIYLPLTLIKQ